jgi:hypothetical protein
VASAMSMLCWPSTPFPIISTNQAHANLLRAGHLEPAVAGAERRAHGVVSVGRVGFVLIEGGEEGVEGEVIALQCGSRMRDVEPARACRTKDRRML